MRALIHFIAECKDCMWSTQDYHKGPARARAHSQSTGHHVIGEAGYAIEFKKGLGGIRRRRKK